MRASRIRPSHSSPVMLAALILAMLLAACAGSDSPDSASSGNPSGSSAAEAGNGAQSGQPAESLAARVNGQPITLTAFERERARRTVGMPNQPASAAAFDADVLQSMIDQMLIEQAAARAGLVVTDAEVDAELAAQSQIASEAGLTLDQFIASQMYTMDEYREALRAMLLWSKVSQDIVAQVPATSTQVHSRHILVADEAAARDILNLLAQGADFAQLAIQYSLDGSTRITGGDLDWVSRGDLLQPEVEAAIFALEPGQISPEPVRSSLGYHVIQTLERVDDRPLDQAKLAGHKEQAFLDWLQTQRDSALIERYVGTGS
ncbi:MAG: SurA N-terminal domain-containing protein [Anaerolineae bacterium]|nr:SurA N-terminal domain-containing protein [Anaerolineae bacterium]